MTRPRLSFILGARNDAYMGNFTWRLETTLNYLAGNLEKLRRLEEVEVVITDWGSKVPLHRVLALGPAARRIVRFILVPAETARSLQGESEFPIVLAQNTAVRHSRGDYIAQTDSDILFPIEFLQELYSILDGHRSIGIPTDHSLLVSRRRQIPWELTNSCPAIEDLDWLIRRVGKLLPLDPMFPAGRLELYTATGFALMHRSLWEECRGYDERFVHWGWMDVDLALRVATKYPWAFLDYLGVPLVYHMEHYHPSTNRMPARRLNPMDCDNPFCANTEEWGLASRRLEEIAFGDHVPDGGGQKVVSSGSETTWDLKRRYLIVLQVICAAFWRVLCHGFSSHDARNFAKYFSKQGRNALRQAQFEEARRYFASAFHYRPFYWKNLTRWLLSYLPGLRDLYVSKKRKSAAKNPVVPV